MLLIAEIRVNVEKIGRRSLWSRRRKRLPCWEVPKHDPRVVRVEDAVVAGGQVGAGGGLIIYLGADLVAWGVVDFFCLDHGGGRLVDLLDARGGCVIQVYSNALHATAESDGDEPGHEEHDSRQDGDDEWQGELGLVGAVLHQNVALHELIVQLVEVVGTRMTSPHFDGIKYNHGRCKDDGRQEYHQGKHSRPFGRV